MNNRRYYDYGIIITLLFLILSLPLYFDLNLKIIFDLAKITVMRVLSLIMISIWLMKALLIGHRFIRTPLDLPITAYLLVSTLSTIFSVSPLLSFIGFYRRYEGLSTLMIYITLFYVTVNFINNRKFLKLTINTAILAGVLTSIYGILQYYKVDPFRFELFEGFRVYSTAGNPAYLAAYLIMVLPLALSMYLFEEKKDPHPSKKKRDKRTREKEFLPYLSMVRPWWYLISFVLIYICLFFTFTRGCILGFMGAMLLFGILSWRAKIIKNKQRLWIFLGILIPMTAWLCVESGKVVIQRFTSEMVKIVKTQPEGKVPLKKEKDSIKKEVQAKEKPLFKKIPEEEMVLPPEPKEDTTKIEFAGSAGSRIRTWKIALKMIADYPLLGVGPESMVLVYPRYASFGFDRVHNDILDTAVTRGIIGLITYLWLLVSFAIFAYRCYKKEPDELNKGLSIGIGTGWVAYLIQNQFNFGMNLASSLFWIMMGIMIGVGSSHSSQREKVMKSKNRIIIWLIGVLIFIIILILFRYTISAYKANIYYKEGVGFLDRKNYAQASLKYEKAIELNPYEEWYYKDLIGIYLKRAMGGEKEYATKGMALAEKANRLFLNDLILYNLLGAAYQLNGRYDQAISAYKKAINRSPYFEDAYDNLAKIYFNQHRYDEAIKTVKTGLKFSPYSKKYLSSLGYMYTEMGNLKEAIRTYSKTLDHSYPESYKSLGYAFYKAGEIDKAISCLKIAARLLPEDINLHTDLGSIYYQTKNLKKAKAQFEYVLKNLNPNDEYAKRMLHIIETNVQ